VVLLISLWKLFINDSKFGFDYVVVVVCPLMLSLIDPLLNPLEEFKWIISLLIFLKQFQQLG
jgi:hypothetical protein